MGDRKKLGTDLDAEVVDSFKAWCRGGDEFAAQAASRALALYMILPRGILLEAQEKNWTGLERWFATAVDRMENEFGVKPGRRLVIPTLSVEQEEARAALSQAVVPATPPHQSESTMSAPPVPLVANQEERVEKFRGAANRAKLTRVPNVRRRKSRGTG